MCHGPGAFTATVQIPLLGGLHIQRPAILRHRDFGQCSVASIMAPCRAIEPAPALDMQVLQKLYRQAAPAQVVDMLAVFVARG